MFIESKYNLAWTTLTGLVVGVEEATHQVIVSEEDGAAGSGSNSNHHGHDHDDGPEHIVGHPVEAAKVNIDEVEAKESEMNMD